MHPKSWGARAGSEEHAEEGTGIGEGEEVGRDGGGNFASKELRSVSLADARSVTNCVTLRRGVQGDGGVTLGRACALHNGHAEGAPARRVKQCSQAWDRKRREREREQRESDAAACTVVAPPQTPHGRNLGAKRGGE